MKQVERLSWDSSFFGYEVGKLTIERIDDLQGISSDYKLLYVFGKKRIPELDEFLMDCKVVYSCDVSSLSAGENESPINLEPFNIQAHSYEKLLELVYQSGSYSRFAVDKKFCNGEFERLYKQWIDLSINKSIAKEVMVATFEDKIVGFITMSNGDEDRCNIGLLAVDSAHRGKKIGKKLIGSVKKLATENGFRIVDVVTQKNNLPAVGLYQSCGFTLTDENYIYHIWNNDTI